MNRRAFLKAIGSAALTADAGAPPVASTNFSRRRPSDATWPSQAAWKQLNDAVGGNLIPVNFPLSVLKTDPTSDAAKQLLEDLKIRITSAISRDSRRPWDGSMRGLPSQASMRSRREMPRTSLRR